MTTPFAGEVKASGFWDSQGVLFIDFLIKQRNSNGAYYSKLLKNSFFQNNEVDQ
jgi:hypothetical protein